MRDIYLENPRYQNKLFLFRKVSKNDLEDLFYVYSDIKSVPFFNCDNCNGDSFYYDDKEKMERALLFWKTAYKNKWFVRLSIIDRNNSKAIGTLEICLRKSVDSFDNSIILRIDLKSEYENEEVIDSILKATLPKIEEFFGKKKVITKGFDDSIGRTKALLNNGFCLSKRKLLGSGDVEYGNYYVTKR